MNEKLKEKIIVALDVDNIDSAISLTEEVGHHIGAVKVGLEIMNNSGAPQIVSALQTGGSKIFFDGKFCDIPNTVAGASRAVTRLGVWMFNVHALGGRVMMEKALEAAEYSAKSSNVNRPLVIAVTILTSMDKKALDEIGYGIENDEELKEKVAKLAELAKTSGLDGVVASPHEVSLIREVCGNDFKIVTPGVRPRWAVNSDQRRVMTPKEAIDNGADYLVIGRPITKPPTQIGTPADAVKKILEELND